MPDPDSEPTMLPNMNPTIGPEEVGVIAGAWMFGLFTMQVPDIVFSSTVLLTSSILRRITTISRYFPSLPGVSIIERVRDQELS